jgi:hypothetical protein
MRLTQGIHEEAHLLNGILQVGPSQSEVLEGTHYTPVVGCVSRRETCTIVTPDFPKKTKFISYVRQDQVYTHMIDVMSEISINNNKNVQELNHYIIPLLHSDDRLEDLYNDQTITMKTQLHLHLPQAHDWGHASLRTPPSR